MSNLVELFKNAGSLVVIPVTAPVVEKPNAIQIAEARAAEFNKRSDKYRHFDTVALRDIAVSELNASGFKIDSSVIGLKTARKGAKNTSHTLTITIDSGDIEFKPRLVVSNSYNGEGSLKFSFGLYRLVCSNGLMVGQDIIKPIRVRHLAGQTADQFERDFRRHVREAAQASIRAAAEFRASLQSVTIEGSLWDKRDAFLKFMAERGELSARQVKIARRIPLRSADRDGTAWGLFNAVQESLMTDAKGHRRVTAAAAARNERLADQFSEFLKAA
jgi:hypothetical protein